MNEVSKTPKRCGKCDDKTPDTLSREVSVSIDGNQVDEQRLCPECFADWLQTYQDILSKEKIVPAEEESEVETDEDDMIIE